MHFDESWNNTCSKTGLAARGGNHKVLKQLLKNGKPVDVRDNRGWTALHEAAAKNYHKCVQLILSYDDSIVNWVTHENETALSFACLENGIESAQILLDYGADPNICNNMMFGPLSAAIERKNKELVLLLLEHGAHINNKDINEVYPVHYAAKAGEVFILRLLSQYRVDFSVQDCFKHTPLEIAAFYCNLDALKYLVKPILEKDNADKSKITAALLLACKSGDVSCIQFLLQSGADISFTDEFGYTALHYSLNIGNDEKCINELIGRMDFTTFKLKANLNIIHLAVVTNRCNLISALLEKQLPVDYVDQMREEYQISYLESSYVTPIVLAIAYKNTRAFEILLEAGASVNSIQDNCVPPLVMAVLNPDFEIVQRLLTMGSDIHSLFSVEFMTILSAVVKKMEVVNVHVIECLLKAGLSDTNLCKMQLTQCHINWLNVMKSLENFEKLLLLLHQYIDTNIWQKIMDFVDRDLYDDNTFPTNDLQNLKGCIHSLQELCRLRIRKSLMNSKPKSLYVVNLKELPIPETLQDYLLYECVKS